MTTHKIATRQEWLNERLDLLKAEKEHTRQSDALAKRRQALPWVRVDKAYRFDTDAGPATLADLFRGRSQLIVYHLMFGPEYKAACPSCSAIADGFNGIAVHLENHDVAFNAVSRAPLAKLDAFKQRMGWSFPWASSLDSDFNFDFQVSLTEEAQDKGTIEYNYQQRAALPDPDRGPNVFATAAGTDTKSFMRQLPGMSAFIRDGDAVYHTYSAYARGLDGLWNMYQWLDRAPLGRNENGMWWRHHDMYGKA